MDRERLIELCDLIGADVEKDAEELDGKPFDGKTVATQFGHHGAAIKALANIIKELLKDKATN